MTDAQRAGKGMGVLEALAVLGNAVDRLNYVPDTLKGVAALDTLAAKLRAGDALAEAALEYMDAGVEQATAQVNTQRVELRLVNAEKNLTAALAVYKQAGMGGESRE